MCMLAVEELIGMRMDNRRSTMIRVDLVDPSAYTPPYDHALASALARRGARVRLVHERVRVRIGPGPPTVTRSSPTSTGTRSARAGSRRATASKAAEHVPDMLAYRRRARDAATSSICSG